MKGRNAESRRRVTDEAIPLPGGVRRLSPECVAAALRVAEGLEGDEEDCALMTDYKGTVNIGPLSKSTTSTLLLLQHLPHHCILGTAAYELAQSVCDGDDPVPTTPTNSINKMESLYISNKSTTATTHHLRPAPFVKPHRLMEWDLSPATTILRESLSAGDHSKIVVVGDYDSEDSWEAYGGCLNYVPNRPQYF